MRRARLRGAAAPRVAQVNTLVLGQAERGATGFRRAARRWTSADRGFSRRRQDQAGPRARSDARSCSSACSSLRPAAVRHRRGVGLRPQSKQFEFHPGPMFAQLLLADEINRPENAKRIARGDGRAPGHGRRHTDRLTTRFSSSPRRIRWIWPAPTLARFAARLVHAAPRAGNSGRDAERALLSGADRRELIAQATPLLGSGDVLALRQAVADVHASDARIAYPGR